MPRQAVIAGSLGLVFFGALGYRIIELEAQIDELARALDGSKVVAEHDNVTTPTTQTASGLSHQQRLVAVERQLSALRAGVYRISLAMQPNSGPPDPETVDDIVNVVEVEHSRRRHTHLEWERPRWLDAREAQLVSFAHNHKLSTDQVNELERGLTREVDAMMEVLQRPDLYEDPERTARDWEDLLAETDRIAGRVLSREQLTTWTQVRLFERKVLWPWLPEKR